MGHLAPAGPVYQAGHAVREPGRGRRRAGHPAGTPTTPSTPRSTRTRTGSAAARRRADRRGRAAPRAVRRATCSRCSSPTTRCTTTPAARRRRPGASPAFFHALLDRGCTRRRARSRRGSSPRRSTTRRWQTIEDALPHAAKAAATAIAPTEAGPMTVRTVVHLLRHGEVHNPDGSSTAGSRLPALGARARPGRRWSPKALADADLDRRARLAAAAGPGDRRARSPRSTAWRSSPTTG